MQFLLNLPAPISFFVVSAITTFPPFRPPLRAKEVFG